MSLRHAFTAHLLPSLDERETVDAWRAWALDLQFRVGSAIAFVLAALASALALRTNDWAHALFGWGMFTFALAAGWAPGLTQRTRTWCALVVLYAGGTLLLLRGGAGCQLFFLACPVLAALMLDMRTAMALLGLCTATLAGVGWWLDIPLGMVGSTQGRTGLHWFNLATTYALLGVLLSLTCGFLLRRLEDALTRQRTVAESLRASEETLRQITAQVPGMVFRLRFDQQNQPHFLYASPGAQTLFNRDPQALMADGRALARLIEPADRGPLMASLASALGKGEALQNEFRVRLDDGRIRWIQVQSHEVARGPQGLLHNGIMVDITDRKAAEALVWTQAHVDPLTNLPNRLTLHDRVNQAMANSRRSGQALALMLIDLDHFKEINDTLGHACGDQLLVQAAQRIGAVVRACDTVARMGGDEFTVLLPELTEPAQAEAVGLRILQALQQPFELGDERAYVSASIGVTRYPGDADDLDGLLKHADQAMYLAKDSGRNRLSWFTGSLQDQAQLRMRLARDLRGALAQGQFHVVYQPIVELDTGRVRKAEALLRWQHPERGLVSPAVFIPIAESTGLIGEIGDWVFRTAAAQARLWRERIDPRFQISVNRSPLQFRADMQPPQPWPEVLAQLGLAGDAIAVEITEGLLLDSGPEVRTQLQALRDAGLAVSLDDFGTGYSALAYLHQFAIDTLKIDRSFVSGMAQGDTSRKLCRAMVLMAHELGMDVVAEGVETAEQRDWLRQAGCDLAQGWHYGKPMAPEAFEAWLGLHLSNSAETSSPASTRPAAAAPSSTAHLADQQEQ